MTYNNSGESSGVYSQTWRSAMGGSCPQARPPGPVPDFHNQSQSLRLGHDHRVRKGARCVCLPRRGRDHNSLKPLTATPARSAARRSAATARSIRSVGGRTPCWGRVPWPPYAAKISPWYSQPKSPKAAAPYHPPLSRPALPPIHRGRKQWGQACIGSRYAVSFRQRCVKRSAAVLVIQNVDAAWDLRTFRGS